MKRSKHVLLEMGRVCLFTAVQIWLLCLGLQAQDYGFKAITTNDGLSQSTVFSILQDQDGFMWFGTRTGGLNKFDGMSFTHYKKDISNAQGLSGNEVVSLFQSSDGIIWVGTRGDGLCRFDPQTEQFEQHYHNAQEANTIPSNTVVGVCEDEQGKVWLATNSGLCQYQPASKGFKRILNSETGKSFGQILAVVAAGEDQVAVGTKQHGIYILDVNMGAITAHHEHDPANPTSISSNYVYALHYDSRGRLWAGTRNDGLNRLDRIGSTEFQRFQADAADAKTITSNIIRIIREDRNGNIWVGTKNGLSLIQAAETGATEPSFVQFKNDPARSNSLSQNSIYAFEEDDAGNYWVGTWSGGVNYLNSKGNKFKRVQRNSGQSKGSINHAVSAFTRTPKGLWVGTEGGGLYLNEEASETFTPFQQIARGRLKSDHIKALYYDGSNSLWIGTYNGLHHYDLKRQQVRHCLAGKSIYTIEQGDAETLWVGSGKGLFKLNKQTLRSAEYVSNSQDPGSLSNNSINHLCQDSRGRLWVATKNGLNCYQDSTGTFSRFFNSRTDTNSISNNLITSVYEDASGRIWIGTVDGLNRFVEADSSFVHVGESEGLPDNVINSILGDQTGSLWLATNKGISQFQPGEELLESTAAANKPTVKNYTYADGLQGNEFLLNAAYADDAGQLYLGGTEGFNAFDPGQLTQNERVPQVTITDFKLFNQEVSIGKAGSPLTRHISVTDSLILTHEQSVFSFQFVALNYESPDKNEYAYKLEGLDENWNYIGHRREVSYSSLPPGEYVFRVIASNNDGVWNRKGAKLNLIILPPWWRTTWFMGTAFLSICLLVLIGVRLRVRKLKQDQAELREKLDAGRAEIADQRQQVENQANELKLRDERERDMRWYNNAFIELSTILSENRDDPKRLFELFLSKLLTSTEAQMGAVYIAIQDGDEQWLELRTSYAADSNRTIGKRVAIQEGLVGTSFHERENIQLDTLPAGFANFSSGLGKVDLQHLLLVPIQFEENVEGVLELVSLERLSETRVQLVENIGKQLAALLTTQKANQQIELMLEDTAQQKEALAAQEEELRQAIEELTVTQEETQRREKHLEAEIAKLKSELGGE